MKNEIVIGMITKNSYTSRGKILLETIEAINKEIPYDTFILGDSSNDNTDVIIESMLLNKKLIKVDGGNTRAIARQRVIEKFLELNCRWLLFVDDDAILNKGWYDEAKKYLDESGVGLIWGINWDAIYDRREWLRKLGIDYREYLIEQFWLRGGMHDTLLSREAIKDIKIPSFLHVYEDYWIMRHVENKGYKIKILDKGVSHKNPAFATMSRKTLLFYAKIGKSLNIHPSSLLSIVRAFVGLPLNLFNAIKGGLGLKRGFKRWYEKIMYRALLYFLSRYEIDDRYKQTRKERKLVSTWARRFLK